MTAMHRHLLHAFLALIFLASRGLGDDDFQTVSPKKTFIIVQWNDGDEWLTKIEFAGHKAPDIRLIEGYPWPAVFYISPDEHWIFQLQKSGSGENIGFLYRLENNHLWRSEDSIKDRAFILWLHSQGREPQGPAPESGFYHTGLEFTAWDIKRSVLCFGIHGTSDNNDGAGMEQALFYHLDTQAIEKK